MPMQTGQWDQQVQLPVCGADSCEVRPSAIAMQTPPNTHSSLEHKRFCPAPELQENVHLRRGVEGAMLPEELTVMRKALAEMQQVRSVQPSSLDSLPKYQGR